VNAATTLEFWVVAVELLALLAFVGYPIGHLARRWSGGALAVPAPVLGIAAVALLSWWWVRATGLGLEVGVPAIAGVAALAWVPVAVDLRRRRPSLRAVAERMAVPVVTLVAVAILFSFHFSSAFRLDHLSSAAGSNIDVAAYSLVAGHLVGEGLSGTGNIEGYDLSKRAEEDAFGATALVATAAVASERETWEVGTAVLFVTIAALALSAVALLRRLWPEAGLLAAGAALAGVASFLFVYLTLQFFLAQILAAALLGAVLVAFLAAVDARSWRAVAASAGVIGLLGVGMITTYPHMALFAPAVLLPAALVCLPRTGLRQGVLRVAAAVAGGAVVAVALAPDQFVGAIRRAEVLSGVQAGWPLPAFLPTDLVGALGTEVPAHDAARWAGSVALLLGIGACAALRWRADRLGRFTVVGWAGALASYAVVYAWEGESYRQWKWITTFLPLLVALGAAVVVAAGIELARRASVRPQVATAGALAALVLVVALQTAKADPFISRFLGGSVPGVYVNADLAAIISEPRVAGLKRVAFNFTDPGEYQWAAAIIRPREVLPYPTPTDDRPWILERVGAPVTPGREVVGLNATYQLAQDPPASPG
jgi:hypothetical protein